MAASALFKVLVTGCILYLFCTVGEASLAEVESLTSSIVKRSLPVTLHHVFEAEKSARFKRDVVATKLEDPEGCLKECLENQTMQPSEIIMQHMARMVALASAKIFNQSKTPQDPVAFQQEVTETTVANMDPMFDELCKVHKSIGQCYSKCPESQARSILGMDEEVTRAGVCEPSKNWKSFSEYWHALNCTNSTKEEKACGSACGPDEKLRDVTNVFIDDIGVQRGIDRNGTHLMVHKPSSHISIQYESDADKNTDTADRVCKSTSCRLDCYKAIITEKCGPKAYDTYNRMSKIEMHGTLEILKALNAIGKPDECKPFA